MNSPFGRLLVDLLLFFRNTYQTLFRMPDPPLHDPCAVAYVLHPELFECQLMRVDVETSSELTVGATCCDIYGFSNKRKNVLVALKMDVEKFWQLMLQAFHKANAVSLINTSAASPAQKV